MTEHLEITKFFATKRKMSQEIVDKKLQRISVRSMKEICQTPEKVTHCVGGLPGLNHNNEHEVYSLISSDEENCTKTPSFHGTGKSARSKISASGAVQYEHLAQNTSNKQSPPNTGCIAKFYSPTKKRSVKKSPIKRAAPSSCSVIPKKLFAEGNGMLNDACSRQDDKTKFLLHAVQHVLRSEELALLVGDIGCRVLRQYLDMQGTSARLVCRVYWRKARWYRRSELLSIVGASRDIASDSAMLKLLLESGLLLQGSSENMEFDDYVNEVLKQDELKNICKNLLKLKSQSKMDATKQLRAYCSSTTNITNYFTVRQHNSNKTSRNSNTERVLKLLREAAGACFKLSEECRDVLHRVHVLTYLGLDPEVLRSRTLELLLLNVKTGRESFPALPADQVDTPGVVFRTQHEFENYMIAHTLYEEFLQSTETARTISLIQHAYNLLREMEIDFFRLLPPWLRRFTPAYLYIKIIEEGLPELKKGKDPSLCRLAVDILSALLHQDLFRQHKCADWYDEKALILHYYLHQPDQAASVLLEAFGSDLTEEAKDTLRPRAGKLAQQKNIKLHESQRASLLAHATKQQVLESSLPNTHFYKQAMDNTTKGKIVFESRNEDGSRTMSSVENFAISCYLETGQFTHGRHWEGRIVNTLFFVLFWDIIYSKPKGVHGIFLCQYQRYPLDMFSDTFYQSRKEAIEERLKCIESSSIDDVVQLMCGTWNSRPEGEHSGITCELGWECVVWVARCLRPRRLSAICRRLAQNYRYSHSGFPDLTIWNADTGKIKFSEVKSDSDKPSLKQLQWVQYLLAHDIDAELCYVGTRGAHH